MNRRAFTKKLMGGLGVVAGLGMASKTSTGALSNLSVDRGGILFKDFVPSGAVDGSNTVFTIPAPHITGSENVIVNGLVYTSNNDYTISDSTITFITPPSRGDILRVQFVSQGVI